MDADAKIVCLKVLSALAWADGVVSDDERRRLTEFLCYTCGFGAKEVDGVLKHIRNLTPDTLTGVAALPLPTLAEVLLHGYAMANEDPPVSAEELAVLEQVVTTCAGAEHWPDARAWIEARYTADRLYAKLFQQD